MALAMTAVRTIVEEGNPIAHELFDEVSIRSWPRRAVIDAGDDVVDVFDPDGKTDQLGGIPLPLLFLVKLGMGRSGRVNGQLRHP